MTSSPPRPLFKTIVCLSIGIGLDLIVAMFALFGLVVGIVTSFSRAFGPGDDDIAAMIVLVLVIGWLVIWAGFKLLVVLQLRKQKRWAWIAALVISGFGLLSIPYLILSIINLVGLLNNEVITWFKTEQKAV